jgi:hypothetical protein
LPHATLSHEGSSQNQPDHLPRQQVPAQLVEFLSSPSSSSSVELSVQPIPDLSSFHSHHASTPLEYLWDAPRLRAFFARHIAARASLTLVMIAVGVALMAEQPTTPWAAALMLSALGLLVVIFSAHLVTSGGILANSLCTFEAGYLSIWMSIFLACACYEYPYLYDTFGRRHGLTLFWFWVQQCTLLFGILLLFCALVIVDAFPSVGRNSKIAVRILDFTALFFSSSKRSSSHHGL